MTITNLTTCSTKNQRRPARKQRLRKAQLNILRPAPFSALRRTYPSGRRRTAETPLVPNVLYQTSYSTHSRARLTVHLHTTRGARAGAAAGRRMFRALCPPLVHFLTSIHRTHGLTAALTVLPEQPVPYHSTCLTARSLRTASVQQRPRVVTLRIESLIPVRVPATTTGS